MIYIMKKSEYINKKFTLIRKNTISRKMRLLLHIKFIGKENHMANKPMKLCLNLIVVRK